MLSKPILVDIFVKLVAMLVSKVMGLSLLLGCICFLQIAFLLNILVKLMIIHLTTLLNHRLMG